MVKSPAGMNQRADRETSRCLYCSGCAPTASPGWTTLHRHVRYRIAPIACTGAAANSAQLQRIDDPGTEPFEQDRFRVLEGNRRAVLAGPRFDPSVEPLRICDGIDSHFEFASLGVVDTDDLHLIEHTRRAISAGRLKP